jgi:hypothetical protein
MSQHKAFFGAIVVLSALSIAVPTAVAGQGHGSDKKPAKVKAEKHENKPPNKADKHENKPANKADKHDTAPVVAVDRDGHVRVIREYAYRGSLPPGLAKREALPPGLRAQLRERGTLPPGLQKRLVPVPTPLIARLPGVPSYYQRYFIGEDLVVLDTRSNIIAALVPDVWR